MTPTEIRELVEIDRDIDDASAQLPADRIRVYRKLLVKYISETTAASVFRQVAAPAEARDTVN